jgi:hypothetical protein
MVQVLRGKEKAVEDFSEKSDTVPATSDTNAPTEEAK